MVKPSVVLVIGGLPHSSISYGDWFSGLILWKTAGRRPKAWMATARSSANVRPSTTTAMRCRAPAGARRSRLLAMF